jgi:hypothetical protein
MYTSRKPKDKSLLRPSPPSICSSNSIGPDGATAFAAQLALLTSLQAVDLRCPPTPLRAPAALSRFLAVTSLALALSLSLYFTSNPTYAPTPTPLTHSTCCYLSLVHTDTSDCHRRSPQTNRCRFHCLQRPECCNEKNQGWSGTCGERSPPEPWNRLM